MTRRGYPWPWQRRSGITSNTSDFASSRERFPKLHLLARQPFRQTQRRSRPGTNRTPQGGTPCSTLHVESSRARRSAPVGLSPLDAKAPESRTLAQPILNGNRTFPATPPCDSIYLLLIIEVSATRSRGIFQKMFLLIFLWSLPPFLRRRKTRKIPSATTTRDHDTWDDPLGKRVASRLMRHTGTWKARQIPLPALGFRLPSARKHERR
jgi:hypothetical protein